MTFCIKVQRVRRSVSDTSGKQTTAGSSGAGIATQNSASAASASAASFAALEKKLGYLPPADLERVRKAYRYADQAHLGQLRNSGAPYITHPISVAAQCAEWRLDAETLMASLLHDSMEDCGITKSDLVEEFGAPVAELVDGATKLDKLKFTTREENQAESFRKMLLAMSRDVRVILVKIADRTHNMRTMGDMPSSKWRRISTETLDIYAPIAYRLGLHSTYRELQDLCLRYMHPWRYRTLERALTRARARRTDLIARITAETERAFASAGMKQTLHGSDKRLYSVYRRMRDDNLSFSKVSDVYTFQVLVEDVTSCYTALGIIHQLYKPVPGRFKDFIAIPKVNGYQSLHTAVVGPMSISIEFQIRTGQMDVVAESGIAAHWLYQNSSSDAGGDTDTRLGARWLQSLLDIQNETRDAAEFWEHVRVDLFPDAIYVYTPKGRILALPRGASTIDFAYAVHSDLGDTACSAIVNGEVVPLSHQISSGDVVEISTSPTATPEPGWLAFVRTGRARSRIRNFLKHMAQSDSERLGANLLAAALRAEGYARLPPDTPEMAAVWESALHFTGSHSRSELFVDIAQGKRIAAIVARHLMTQLAALGLKPDPLLLSQAHYSDARQTQGVLTVDGSEGSQVTYAICCRPIPGDSVVGYLGRGEGLSIHRARCAVAQRLRSKDSERFAIVEWADESARPFEAGVIVTVDNRRGALARVSAALARASVDITQVDMGNAISTGAAELRLLLAVRNREHLEEALRLLRHTPSVLRAERIFAAARQDG